MSINFIKKSSALLRGGFFYWRELEKSAFNVVRRIIEAAQMANCSNISSFLGVACADLMGQVKDGWETFII